MERDKVGLTLQVWPSKDTNMLFNDEILSEVNITEQNLLNGDYSVVHPGPDLTLRPLQRTDYDKGYVSLLSQLTRVGEVSREQYETQFDAMKQCPGAHYIVVVEDTVSGKVVSSASLSVERKFIHSTALRGRLEDVVVDNDYRGRHLGSLLVAVLTDLSRLIGCYKVSLDCKPNVQEFYKKYGFKNESQLFMCKRFYD